MNTFWREDAWRNLTCVSPELFSSEVNELGLMLPLIRNVLFLCLLRQASLGIIDLEFSTRRAVVF